MTGAGAKIGEWYEAGYVVWQFIRLLEGRVDAVLWEGIDEDEKGVVPDYFLRFSRSFHNFFPAHVRVHRPRD